MLYGDVYLALGFTMTLPELAELSKAMLTPVIALITTYIAWQQWKANELKLRLERYDRRLAIYGEVRKILSIVARDAVASNEDLLKFRTSVSEADFLFGDEIVSYIDEIYSHGLKLARWTRQYKDYTQVPPPNYDHLKVVDGMDHELTWLTEQFLPAKEKFKKYLDINK